MSTQPLSDTESNKACEKSMQIDMLVLPAAPQANNKKRFGAIEKPDLALQPGEAVAWIGDLIKGGKEVHGVNISGPGDALAAPELLLPLLDLLKEKYADCPVRLTSIGLNAASLAGDLASKGIAQVNLQVEAVSEDILKKIYAWIRPGKRTIPLPEVVGLLLQEQEKALASLKKAGILVNIYTTVYPGVNDEHISAIAEKTAAWGASSITLIPFEPVSEEEKLEACDTALLESAKQAAAAHLTVTDDVDLHLPPPSGGDFQNATTLLPQPSKERPNVAVVSTNGMDIDLHLGQATQILIYGPREDGLACLLETRPTPDAGSGDTRWEALAKECLHDCFALLATHAGKNPQKILDDLGVKVLLSEENIEGTIDVLYGGGKKKKCKK
ncbi:MAG: NifB/NifX family molybdenum-iron cluster-binding protein [Candidatus Electrothrix aestuarii]|uniref:NifB/NifX family molybdenum-iron cluster-binding protein n=1 Tax=Candidatus Electrothrix aestuarii TaxID=3062594 RepID=A0AAU8LQL7_9BACT|nr:radical SAM protein [Candidatus Electrothrix aestuarii]